MQSNSALIVLERFFFFFSVYQFRIGCFQSPLVCVIHHTTKITFFQNSIFLTVGCSVMMNPRERRINFIEHFISWIIPNEWASQMALMVKSPPANAGDVRDSGSIPELARPPGGGHGNWLQYSCLENPKNGEPGRLQSTGSKRVRHTWSNLAHMHHADTMFFWWWL